MKWIAFGVFIVKEIQYVFKYTVFLVKDMEVLKDRKFYIL